MSEGPLCSVILVSYHSQQDLARCIPSIQSQHPIEIIVVDNDPNDGTALWLAQHFPFVRIMSSSNGGYGAACNQGMAVAKGQYWFVLNPDTILWPQALDNLVATAIRNPRSLITAALIQPDGTVNAYGNTMHITGITTCANIGEPWSNEPALRYPLLASGAAMMAHRHVWQTLNGFDADYFLYMEDADLSLRAQLQGFPVVCDTRARITHDYTLNLSPNKFYLLERNRWRTMLTTCSTPTLFKLAVPLAATELATWVYALTKGSAYLVAHFKVYFWLFSHHVAWRTKRRLVQGTRVVSDERLMTLMVTAYPLDQLISSRRMAARLTRLSSAFFSLFIGKGVVMR